MAGWRTQETLEVGAISTGDLSVDAHWTNGQPNMGALFPGQRADANLKAIVTGSGNNLRVKLQVAHTVAPEFKDYVTFQAWSGACGTGTAIPAAGLLVQGTPPLNSTVDVCVRFTLNTLAPSSLQGKPMDAKVVVTGLQVTN